MNLLKIFFISSLLIIGLSQSTFSQKKAQSNEQYIIYSAKEDKLVEASAIIDELDNYDVLFYGEQHTDVITHGVQFLLLQMMYSKYGDKTVLSMEMFDRDVQYILDEYFNDYIKESYFRKDSRSWGNYKDYRPMVEFAKDKKLKVIAANAPFRYVSLVNKYGLDTLQLLSEQAKKSIAPLPYNYASGAYAEKLKNLGKDDNPKKKKKKKKKSPMSGMKKLDIIPGHSLWDATMAYSVYQHHTANPESKILHLNGVFHTEEFFGIIQRLKEYDSTIKPLVITSVAKGKKLSKIDFSEYKDKGDYIIFTKSKLE